MAKQGASEGQTESQTGDPWSAGQDPWANAKSAVSKTHEDNAVPESPMPQSFHAPKDKEEDAKTEEEDADTNKKGQTVNDDTGARSSQDGSATETKMELAKKINKLPEAELACASGVSRVLSHLSVLNGERPGDDQKKANREAMYQVGILRGETLTDYVLRRERQFDEAEKHGTVFPDQTKAQMLEEGANLSWQSQQNLKSNMFGHESDYSRLKKS